MSGDRLPVPGGRRGLDALRHRELDALADRTRHLLREQPAHVLWERTIAPSTRVWVRADDVVVVGDELVDAATGDPPAVWTEPPPGAGAWSEVRERPGGRRRWPRLGVAGRGFGPTVEIRSRLFGQLLVVLSGGRRYATVEAFDLSSGTARGRHRVRWSSQRAAWHDWLAGADVDVVDLGGRALPDEPMGWLDPETGERRWSLPPDVSRWSLTPLPPSSGSGPADPDGSRPRPTGRGRRAAGAGSSPAEMAMVVAHQADTVAGVDAASGAVRWKTSLDRYAGLVDVQATGREVAAVSRGRDGDYEGWINLSVRNRGDGRHRWNRWWSAERGTRNVAAVCLDAIVTLEGSFLRARRLHDGEVRWSLPVEAVAGMTSDRHPSPRSLPWLNVVEANPLQPWAWLQRRGVGSAFIHGRTGRVVPVEGAIHLSPRGLVVTRAGPVVRALSLPADSDAI